MRDRKETLDRLGIAVLIVSFESPEVLARFRWFRDLPFTVLSNATRSAYRAFGLRPESTGTVIDWATIKSYLRGAMRGYLPRRPHGDVHQVGGDFVLNRMGEVTFAYRSQSSGDRPAIDTLLHAVQTASEDDTLRILDRKQRSS